MHRVLLCAALAAAGSAAACVAKSTAPPLVEIDAGPDAGARDARASDAAGGRDATARDGASDAAPADSGPDGGLVIYTWWADVRPIVYARCVQCHDNPPHRGAPFPLLTYADTQAVYALTQEVIYRTMATAVSRTNASMRQPPQGSPQLTAEEIQTIVLWAAVGAPEGEPPADASVDAGDTDATELDAGDTDATELDAGDLDAAEVDSASKDAAEDASEMDAAEAMDAAETDATESDATESDAADTDAADTDAADTDAAEPPDA